MATALRSLHGADVDPSARSTAGPPGVGGVGRRSTPPAAEPARRGRPPRRRRARLRRGRRQPAVPGTTRGRHGALGPRSGRGDGGVRPGVLGLRRHSRPVPPPRHGARRPGRRRVDDPAAVDPGGAALGHGPNRGARPRRPGGDVAATRAESSRPRSRCARRCWSWADPPVWSWCRTAGRRPPPGPSGRGAATGTRGRRSSPPCRACPPWTSGPGPPSATVAVCTAGFRDQYYGLLGAVTETAPSRTIRLGWSTSGAIDPLTLRLGRSADPVRTPSLAAPLARSRGAPGARAEVADWVDRLRSPKVLVATQTRIVEAVVDPDGDLVPVTPVIAVVPQIPTTCGRSRPRSPRHPSPRSCSDASRAPASAPVRSGSRRRPSPSCPSRRALTRSGGRRPTRSTGRHSAPGCAAPTTSNPVRSWTGGCPRVRSGLTPERAPWCHDRHITRGPPRGSGNLGRTPKVPPGPPAGDAVVEVTRRQPSVRSRSAPSGLGPGGRARARNEATALSSLPPTPLTARPLPPTGAWRAGDPAGQRRFADVVDGRPFHLEGGGVLRHVTVAYETWGELAADASNAVLVCHALTGDSHAAGRAGDGHPGPGWWDGLIGPGRGIDTDRWFVVCTNVLGGCQGTTGPSSIDPATGTPVRLDVPGGHDPRHGPRPGQARRPPRDRPVGRRRRWLDGRHAGARVGRHVPRPGARVVHHRDLALGERAADRLVHGRAAGHHERPELLWRRLLRPTDGDGPHRGLALAREIAQIHYRSEAVFAARFGRKLLDPLDATGTSASTSASTSRATSTTTATSSSDDSTPTPTCASTRRWISTTSAGAVAAWARHCSACDVRSW